VRSLRHAGVRVSLVPKSSLSDVSPRSDRTLAHGAACPPAAVRLLLNTFTLPDTLRPLARSHQQTVYGLLMTSAAAALLTLARDPRYGGGGSAVSRSCIRGHATFGTILTSMCA
jgi:hypothetical protein